MGYAIRWMTAAELQHVHIHIHKRMQIHQHIIASFMRKACSSTMVKTPGRKMAACEVTSSSELIASTRKQVIDCNVICWEFRYQCGQCSVRVFMFCRLVHGITS